MFKSAQFAKCFAEEVEGGEEVTGDPGEVVPVVVRFGVVVGDDDADVDDDGRTGAGVGDDPEPPHPASTAGSRTAAKRVGRMLGGYRAPIE